MAQNIDPKVLLAQALSELDLIVTTVRTKGAKRFLKPVAISLIAVCATYILVYAPPKKKKARLQSEIDAARTLSEFGQQYKDLRDSLASCYAQLPQPKDREMFLSNAVIDSLKAESLTPETFQPVREQEQAGLIFQASNIAMPVKFADFYSWLVRVESAKPLMHLQTLELLKKSDVIGLNAATAEITTVIPKKRYN
jgi:type II secretory pathway component PulM